MAIDYVHREPEPESSFTGEALDDHRVSQARGRRTSNPAVGRGGTDVQFYSE